MLAHSVLIEPRTGVRELKKRHSYCGSKTKNEVQDLDAVRAAIRGRAEQSPGLSAAGGAARIELWDTPANHGRTHSGVDRCAGRVCWQEQDLMKSYAV